MEKNNNIGNTADYDGYGTNGNGIDKTKNDLTTEDFEQRDTPVSADKEERGANAQAIGEEIDRRNSERGATAIAASEAREAALSVSFDEQAKLQEALEKDPTNEKIIAYLKQVNEYISKLISELSQPEGVANYGGNSSIGSVNNRNLGDVSTGQGVVKNTSGTTESIDNSSESEQNDAFIGKDKFIYSNQQDALDSFAK